MLKFGGVMADNNYNNLISKKRKSESFSFLSSLKYIVCLGTIFYLFSSSNGLKTKKDCIPYDNTKLILESSDVDDIVLNLEREFGVEIDDQNIDRIHQRYARHRRLAHIGNHQRVRQTHQKRQQLFKHQRDDQFL